MAEPLFDETSPSPAQLAAAYGANAARSLKALELETAPPAEVGSAPKELLYERGTLRLYHFLPQTDEVYRVPLLMVMATTNRGYLFDLMPGQSMMDVLVQAGFDVYMMDWAAPLPEERGLTLDDYTQDFIPTCIRKVQEHSGEEEVSLAGYCQGGVLSLIYAATHPDGPVKNLALFAVPYNQHGMKLARVWSDERFMDIDRMVDTYGVIPASVITRFFDMLRPAQRTASKLRLWAMNDSDDYVASHRVMERWGDEMLPLPGAYYRDCTKKLMWGNELFTGELVSGGVRADIANIKVPCLHAIAQHDHIVPFESSQPLIERIGSEDKEEVVLKGGHVSLIAGPRAARRMWPKLVDWLSERSY
ncbi:MAG: alpha/beta fold hydrolase [Pseudomonadota bacterium]